MCLLIDVSALFFSAYVIIGYTVALFMDSGLSHDNCYFLLGSIQPRAVHALPSVKEDVYPLLYFLPCFWFSWSLSLDSSMIFEVFLFYSDHAVIIGECSSANDYIPYHFNCLLWILSKTVCSACIPLLMVVFEIFVIWTL